MVPHRSHVFLAGTFLLFAACSADVSDAPLSGDAALGSSAPQLPPPPTILRDVQLVNTDNQFTRPYVPAFRKTADGRVGLNLKGSSANFYLLAPEKLEGPDLQHSDAGPEILADTSPTKVDWSKFEQGLHNVSALTHQTICDTSNPLAHPGDARAAPVACADSPTMDCYDFVVVSGVQTTSSGLWLTSTPVEARVRNPKTPQAELASVTALPGGSKQHVDVRNFLEPMFTRDGKLLVFRISNGPLPGYDPSVNYNIVYGQLTTACDVTTLGTLHPITHAPHDPQLRTAGYGFAQQPFVDGEGNPIGDNVELGGTYPWIDREGRNLFFTSVSSTLFYVNPADQTQVRSRYDARCIPGTSCGGLPTVSGLNAVDESSGTRGVTVMGLWTHGKMTLVDSLVNNTDFGLGRSPQRQRDVHLYEATSTHSGWVHVGMGRDNSGGPPGSTTNSTFIESHENQFNFRRALVPTSPRDVVWTLDTGKGQDELVFDDYLNNQMFIYSEMQPSLSLDGGGIPGFLHFHDGFHQVGHARGTGFTEQPHLQNAANSQRFAVPKFGLVTHARIEPVALGGITGRGLWLAGNSHVDYVTPPNQTSAINASPWSVGLFVDPRFSDDGGSRSLVSFGDGSQVALRGLSALVLTDSAGAARTFVLSPPLPHDGWTHLLLSATASTDAVQSVTLYRDGFPVTTLGSAHPSLRPLGSGVHLGNGFRGWVDELKVVAGRPNAELACEHAHGTLVRSRRSTAALYEAVRAQLRDPSGTRYECLTDYSQDHGVAIAYPPAGTQPVRLPLLFANAQLVYDQPRPDFSGNGFCLTCHNAQQHAGLTLAALSAGTVTEAHDARRQPFQPPPVVQGNVPAGFLPGMSESSAGAWLDPFLYP